jgi:hypothetical protein
MTGVSIRELASFLYRIGVQMHRTFQRFIDHLSSAADPDTLRDAMAQAATQLELSCFAYLP